MALYPFVIQRMLSKPTMTALRSYLSIGSGGGVAISAGGASQSAGVIIFSNSNSINFGLNAGTLTASFAGAAGGGVAISAGGASQSTGTIIFSSSNGIDFGLNAGTLTASHDGLTSQSNQAASASNGSFAFQTIGFSNANNVTFGTSAGSIITASVAPPGAGSVNFSAGTTSNDLTAITFADSNGIVFGLDGSTITASHNGLTSQSNQAASASNGAFTFQTINFTDANNVTFGTSAGSIIFASVAAQSVQPVAASASNGSFLFSTLAFSNANNVTFGTSAGSIITASVNTNGGGGATVSHYSPPWFFDEVNTALSVQQNSMHMVVFDVPTHISASRINFYLSLSGSLSNGNNTGSGEVGAGYALYTQATGANSQSLALLTSYSMTILRHTRSSNSQYLATHYIGLSNATSHSTSQVGITATNASTYLATSINGLRAVAFPMNLTMTPGRYWLGFANSTTVSGTLQNNISIAATSKTIQPQIGIWGTNSSATNASILRRQLGWGSYSASFAAFPNSLALTTDFRYAVTLLMHHFDIAGYGTSTNWV